MTTCVICRNEVLETVPRDKLKWPDVEGKPCVKPINGKAVTCWHFKKVQTKYHNPYATWLTGTQVEGNTIFTCDEGITSEEIKSAYENRKLSWAELAKALPQRWETVKVEETEKIVYTKKERILSEDEDDGELYTNMGREYTKPWADFSDDDI